MIIRVVTQTITSNKANIKALCEIKLDHNLNTQSTLTYYDLGRTEMTAMKTNQNKNMPSEVRGYCGRSAHNDELDSTMLDFCVADLYAPKTLVRDSLAHINELQGSTH